MTCDSTRRQLTAYLDGELEGDRGSVVRGHLRECAECRQIARDEAALRDGLHALPPLEPPSSIWIGVQAKLAAAEVAESKRPAWRRAVSRWVSWLPSAPRFAGGATIVVAALAVLWWRSHRGVGEQPVGGPGREIAGTQRVAPTPPVTAESPARSSSGGDVTAELAAEPSQVTASYADAADELLSLATEARVRWADDRKIAFDTKVAALRADIDHAAGSRPQQQAWRVLIRYLQGAVVRDDVTLASGGAR